MGELESANLWKGLQRLTSARIGLERAGESLATREILAFKWAHAQARDAVFAPLYPEPLATALEDLGVQVARLKTEAVDRQSFLRFPEKGRTLSEDSRRELEAMCGGDRYDVAIAIADGLSATAVNRHALPVLHLLLPALQASGHTLAPVCILEQGRVAVSDWTGAISNSRLSLILLGERPGLSSPDSLGAYLTFGPKVGNTDAQRNCVSNIRPEGLNYAQAADKILSLIRAALRRGLSGTSLKED
ncbi:MAG: ethanolamine ammonia-lyase subunit EutC [Haliscomenobacter sp.]